MKKNKNKVIAEINITPFTDVVLVLLIIFMITTPMLSQHGIKVNLPKAESVEQTEEVKNIEIIIDKDGFVFLDGLQLHFEYIEEALKNALKKHPERAVIIKGDKDIKYDLVVQLIDKAKKAGASKFGLALEKTSTKKTK